MRFELFIALRYLLARRKQAFISLISLISMIGVAVGVMALVIALALMTGLQGELRNRILGSAAHVYVYKTTGFDNYQADVERLRREPGVIGAGPALLGKALVSTERADAFITIKGIDPALETEVTDIASAMQRGSVAALANRGADARPGILLGRDLAEQLGVTVGDSVTLMTPQGTLSPMGVMPRARTAEVVGTYALGLYEFDSEFGMVDLDVAQRLVSKNHPDVIQLRVSDIYAAPAIARRLTGALGAGYLAQDWTDLNQSLFSALWLEKMAISITIGLIVMVGALNIISSLILLVMEKTRDIAILKTMGTSSGRIMRIFMAQGLIIGLTGTTIGGACGLGLCWILDHYEVIQIPQDVYQVSHVPFVVQPLDFAVVIVSALLICFVSTLYPSRQASKLDPVQALRFD